MAQTSISIRVDEDVKREAETLFAKLGLTLSSATNVFFKQAVRTQSIPFSISAEQPVSESDDFLSPEEAQRYSSQILELIEQLGIPAIRCDVNDEGHIIADRDKDPELYDWAVNGLGA